MSIFATVAVVCTLSLCNEYHVDTADTLEDGVHNTQVIEKDFLNTWTDEAPLTKWLTSHKIGETVFEIVSVDFETQEIDEVDLP